MIGVIRDHLSRESAGAKLRLGIVVTSLFGAMVVGAVLPRAWDRLKPTPARSTWLESYHSLLAGPRDLVMVGDSLTARGQWGEHLLGLTIANRGVEGDTTTRLLARLDEISSHDAETIVLMIGINDLGQRLPITEVQARYTEIVRRLAASGSRIIVQSVLRVGKGSRKAEPASIEAFNAWLASIAPRYGCEFLDLNQVLAPDGYLGAVYTIDGTHLSGQGYLRWAEALTERLAPGRVAAP